MYFIFSKVLLFLLFPLNWIIIFLLIALFSKRQKLKRKCFITGVVLLIIFSNPLLLYLFAKNWDVNSAPLNKNKVYSSVIVLGGFSGEDKNGNGVFNENADRFIQGVKLKEEGRVSHILISSGNGNLGQSKFKEAVWTQSVLKEFNLPDSAVLIEPDSRNTFENATFSKQILQKAHLQPPYILVTSAYHMRRSLYIFKKEGMDVVPYSSGRITSNVKFSFLDYMMPDAGVLAGWCTYLKELIGLTVAHLK
ncbi:YdcF family protein [Mucilaginibacter sp. McL0603]|uniref:YdcF family protein n=1 Tax=Mucilaginibacter sp. McL0603 TaxID=3415670 RepID=UPI003CF10788